MNIYVGNVKYEMTGDQLKEMFSAYGEVSSARIISDRETGRSKGFGFVEMPNDSEAKAAIEATNEKEIGGRTLKVKKLDLAKSVQEDLQEISTKTFSKNSTF